MRVLVIGESCKDIFIYGDAKRLSPEAPIPIIEPTHTIENKGMASNVQNNIEALGVDVDLITNLEEIKKIRYVDDSYNYILLRVDENDKVESINNQSLNIELDDYDSIIIVDYNKGFISEEIIQKVSENASCPIFLDTKKKLGDWVSSIDFIKINFLEYQDSKSFIEKNDWISKKLIVTRGKFGCDYNGKNYPTKEVSIKDVAGAGDTFLSGLVCEYLKNQSIEESIKFANKCSTQVVQKRGVSIINKNKL